MRCAGLLIIASFLGLGLVGSLEEQPLGSLTCLGLAWIAYAWALRTASQGSVPLASGADDPPHPAAPACPRRPLRSANLFRCAVTGTVARRPATRRAAGGGEEAGAPGPGRIPANGTVETCAWGRVPKASPRIRLTRVAWIWAVAVLLRAAGLAYPGSDDVPRYLWEGLLQVQGHNPYRHPPSAPELTALRPAWHAQINQPDLAAGYGPLAEATFFLHAWAGGGFRSWRVLVLLLDLVAAWILCRALSSPTDPTSLAIRRRELVATGYLWNPLVVFEFSHRGHLDVLIVLGLSLLILAVASSRPRLAGLAAAACAAVKFPLLALAPLVWLVRSTRLRPQGPGPADSPASKGNCPLQAVAARRSRWGAAPSDALAGEGWTPAPGPAPGIPAEAGRAVRAGHDPKRHGSPRRLRPGIPPGVGLLWATLVVSMLPYLPAGTGLWRTAVLFTTQRHYNDGVHLILAAALGPNWAKILLMGVGLAGLAYGLRQVRSGRWDPPALGVFLVGLLLLLSPTLHPWYGAWLVPLALATACRELRCWALAFGCVLGLGYLIYCYVPPGTPWRPLPGWVAALEHGLVWLLLLSLPLRDAFPGRGARRLKSCFKTACSRLLGAGLQRADRSTAASPEPAPARRAPSQVPRKHADVSETGHAATMHAGGVSGRRADPGTPS